MTSAFAIESEGVLPFVLRCTTHVSGWQVGGFDHCRTVASSRLGAAAKTGANPRRPNLRRNSVE
jgi:hypothetical protein